MHYNKKNNKVLVDGNVVPKNILGELKKTSLSKNEDKDLRDDLKKNGYLYIPNLINIECIEAARNEIFYRLKEVDELADPYQSGIFSGKSIRDKIYQDRGKFWKSVSTGKFLKKVTNGPVLEKLFSQLFGCPAIGFDFIFLRAVPKGKFTHMHCDSGFFTRSTKKVLTCWIAFSEITLDKGPLFIVEKSHSFNDVKRNFANFDVMKSPKKKASIRENPIDFAKKRNVKLLTTNFTPGDVLIFGMLTVHGSFENHSEDKKIRLTCDVRYQPEDEPKDVRYFGINPSGTTGLGYGELNGAKPMTDEWHIR